MPICNRFDIAKVECALVPPVVQLHVRHWDTHLIQRLLHLYQPNLGRPRSHWDPRRELWIVRRVFAAAAPDVIVRAVVSVVANVRQRDGWQPGGAVVASNGFAPVVETGSGAA